MGTHAFGVLQHVGHLAQGASRKPRERRADVARESETSAIDTARSDRDDAPMTTPRRLLVDPVNACDYHLVSRCVQGAFLCGRDRRTGRDYSHRRQWLVDRIKLLARCFAVEIYAYCIMSNHFHLVARYDPLACWRWSDEEVARRWVDAFPPTEKGEVVEERKPEARELLLGNPGRLFRARRTLGSLSDFMKHLRITSLTWTLWSPSTYCFYLIYFACPSRKGGVQASALTTDLQLFRVAFRRRASMDRRGAACNLVSRAPPPDGSRPQPPR